jgi:hypothetical protein
MCLTAPWPWACRHVWPKPECNSICNRTWHATETSLVFRQKPKYGTQRGNNKNRISRSPEVGGSAVLLGVSHLLSAPHLGSVAMLSQVHSPHDDQRFHKVGPSTSVERWVKSTIRCQRSEVASQRPEVRGQTSVIRMAGVFVDIGTRIGPGRKKSGRDRDRGPNSSLHARQRLGPSFHSRFIVPGIAGDVVNQ